MGDFLDRQAALEQRPKPASLSWGRVPRENEMNGTFLETTTGMAPASITQLANAW
jgi:hypothetical protein